MYSRSLNRCYTLGRPVEILVSNWFATQGENIIIDYTIPKVTAQVLPTSRSCCPWFCVLVCFDALLFGACPKWHWIKALYRTQSEINIINVFFLYFRSCWFGGKKWNIPMQVTTYWLCQRKCGSQNKWWVLIHISYFYSHFYSTCSIKVCTQALYCSPHSCSLSQFP